MIGVWLGIALLAVGTYALRAVGPVAFATRHVPRWLEDLAVSSAPAVLAALVVTGTVADGPALTLDSRVAAVGVAVAATAMRRPLPVAIGAAIATAVVLRALGLP